MRPLIVLLIALTALAAWHLTGLRPQRDIFIQGRLTLASAEPVEGAQVDVILVFPETKLKITPQGRQLVALRTLGAGEQWRARPDPAGSYTIEWGPAGDFEIDLKLSCPSKPRRCRLVYRLAGAELQSPRFRLRGDANGRDRWAGFCPDQVLAALPGAARSTARPVAAAEAIGSEEVPEQDMSETGTPLAEDQEIRQRAELALLRINTLSPVALRVRYQLLRYLEQNPAYARNLPDRTRHISTLMRDILGRRLALLGILRSGEAVWVVPEVGLKNLWSDPDEHEAEESRTEDAEQDTLEVHQEGAPRFED